MGFVVSRARRAVSAACAAAVLAALAAGCTAVHPSPSPTATPTTPPTSAPAPTNTLDPNGRTLPGFVTHHQELPPAQPATRGLLAQTGPGWSLQTYRPQVESVNTVGGIVNGFPATVQVLYLVSPQGQRYQLLELDPAQPLVIDSWTAGESVAYVTACDPIACDPTAPTQLLDLLTGELSPVEGVGDALRVGATAPGSVRWWQDGAATSQLDRAGSMRGFAGAWTAASLSPSGRYLAVVKDDAVTAYVSAGLAIVDLEDATLTDIAHLWDEPLTCTPFRWRAGDALDISCYDPQREIWRVFAVGPGAHEMLENKSATATPPPDGPWVEPTFYVSDGVWAGPFTANTTARLHKGPTAIGLARNAGFEQLVVPDAGAGTARIVAAIDGVLYIEATQASNLTLTTAWAYSVSDDSWTELGPLPPAGPTRGLLATQGSPATGMTSWAVAH